MPIIRTCKKCNKRFTRKSNYDTHMRKKIPCDLGPKRARQISSAGGENDNSLWCPLCARSFASRRNLTRHNSRFHEETNLKGPKVPKNGVKTCSKTLPGGNIHPDSNSNLPCFKQKTILDSESAMCPIEQTSTDQSNDTAYNKQKTILDSESAMCPIEQTSTDQSNDTAYNKQKTTPIDDFTMCPIEQTTEDVAYNGEDELIPELTQKDKKKQEREKKRLKARTCQYCHKVFARSDNARRHSNGRCKIKKFIDDLDQQTNDMTCIFGSDEEGKINAKVLDVLVNEGLVDQPDLEELQNLATSMSHNTTNHELVNVKKQQIAIPTHREIITKENGHNQMMNNVGTYNAGTISTGDTINYITINAYGKEDMSYITDEKCKEILKMGFQSVIGLVNHVHLDIDHPENQNLLITNIRDKYVKVWDGKDWEMKQKKEVIDNTIEDMQSFLEEKYDDYIRIETKMKNAVHEQLAKAGASDNQIKIELDKIEVMDKFTKRKFTRFIENSTDDSKKELGETIKENIYNARQMIQKSHSYHRNMRQVQNESEHMNLTLSEKRKKINEFMNMTKQLLLT